MIAEVIYWEKDVQGRTHRMFGGGMQEILRNEKGEPYVIDGIGRRWPVKPSTYKLGKYVAHIWVGQF